MVEESHYYSFVNIMFANPIRFPEVKKLWKTNEFTISVTKLIRQAKSSCAPADKLKAKNNCAHSHSRSGSYFFYFFVQCKRMMLLLMLPNWIIHKWRRINMKTCANIQSSYLQPPIAFYHFTNSSAKILVILIVDAVVLFMAKRNIHIAFGECAECTAHTDRFRWTVIRICRRTTKTVNFDAIFECKNFANANRVAETKLRENFTWNI